MTARAGGLVLFHGAGGDRDHRLFLAMADRLELPVARCNFAYRDAGPGRRPPDRMPKLVATIRERVAELADGWGVSPFSIVVGGRSMGGRAASIAVAEGMPAGGLLLLSYPLHPPGKPESLRTEHLAAIGVPGLLVQGTRDAFGRPDEFEAHFAYGGTLRTCWLDGATHDPRPAFDDRIVSETADWLGAL